MPSVLRESVYSKLYNSTDPIIKKYFTEFISGLKKSIDAERIFEYRDFFTNDPDFMELRYCIDCGMLLEDGHDCEESKKRIEEEKKNKTKIVKDIDEFEELLKRVEKFKDIDWDEDGLVV